MEKSNIVNLQKYDVAKKEAEWNEYLSNKKSYDDRAELVELCHEDAILIERINLAHFTTWLHVDPKAREQRVRQSWYGRVLKTAVHTSGDDIKDFKKNALKKDDIICYNAETPYSLNINGFYDLWVLSIENVIAVDRGVKLDELFAQTLDRKLEMQIIADKAAEEQRKEEELRKAERAEYEQKKAAERLQAQQQESPLPA